jgi:hypothetical protein
VKRVSSLKVEDIVVDDLEVDEDVAEEQNENEGELAALGGFLYQIVGTLRLQVEGYQYSVPLGEPPFAEKLRSRTRVPHAWGRM